MKQTIYEEIGGSYSMVGDYRLPDLAVNREEVIIGPWGQRHLRYLRQYRRISYVNLLATGRLPAYLAEVDWQAQEMFTLLTEQYAAAEGVRTAQGRKPVGMGAADEQHPGAGDRACPSGADLHLSGFSIVHSSKGLVFRDQTFFYS